MRWFKHFTDSYINLKHREILYDFGLEGYGLYWLCLELVGQQGSNFGLNGSKSWKKALKSASGISEEKLEKILMRFSELNLICSKSLGKGNLYIPKMKERADEWTARNSRVTHELLGIDKNRIDKIRIEYIRLKGLDIKNFFPDDYARTTRAIKNLVSKAGGKDELVLKGLAWIAQQRYDWTLETLARKWADFMKEEEMPEIEKKWIKK